MEALTPIAGVSLEQFAELSAVIADQPDAQQALQLIQQRGVSREDWLAAKAGWQSRIEDPSLGGVVSVRFVPAYQAALTQLHGGAPSISFEDYVLLSAQIMHAGLSATLTRLDLDVHRYTQIAFQWNAAMSREPQKFVVYVCMVEAELLRMHRGGERRGIPSLTAALATQATTFASGSSPPPAPIAEAAYPPAPMPAAAPLPAPAPAPLPVPAPAPVIVPAAPPAVPAPAPPPVAAPAPAQAQPPAVPPAANQQKSIEQEASEAAKAVGGALMSGFNKIGSALDSFGKSIAKPSVGSAVLVAWSDGNKYPGTVAQIAPGQYFITMANGQQLWVPEQFVSMA